MLASQKGGRCMKYFSFAVALLLFAGIALAADVDGKWTGNLDMGGQAIPVNYTFKADGATLTGTSSGPNDTTVPIKNGKIDGNNISFIVTFDMGGQEMKIDYKGVVAPDQVKLSFEMMDQKTEILLKRAK
jgi:hypothetical protein